MMTKQSYPPSLALFMSMFFVLTTLLTPAAIAQDDNTAIIIAPDVIGIIAGTEGQVMLRSAGLLQDIEAVPIQTGQIITLNDTIITAGDARAHILLIDDTEIRLGAHTELRIPHYVYAVSQNAGRALFVIDQGSFRIKNGSLYNPQDNSKFVVKIPHGTIEPRMDSIWGAIETESGGYDIFTDEGDINYQTERGRVRIDAGHFASSHNARSIPARAQEITEDKNHDIEAALAIATPDIVKNQVEIYKGEYQPLSDAHMQTILDEKEQAITTRQQDEDARKQENTDRGRRYVPASRKLLDPESRNIPASAPPPQAEEHIPASEEDTHSEQEQTNNIAAETQDNGAESELKPEPEAEPEAEAKSKPESELEPEPPAMPVTPSAPIIPRESNDAVDFEKWERYHLDQEAAPQAPAAL